MAPDRILGSRCFLVYTSAMTMRASIAVAFAASMFLLANCAGGRGDRDTITATPHPLSPSDPARTGLGDASVLGIMELKAPDPVFGGISGMAFDGRMVTAITDLGHWLRFSLHVDQDGRPVAVGDLRSGRLGGIGDGKRDSDAEELLITDAGWLVSFERDHRVLAYPANDLDGTPTRLEMPADFGRQPENGGAEAMAALPDGRVVILSEEGEDGPGLGWAWVGQGRAWLRLTRVYEDAFFRPSAATALPDGSILAIERGYSLGRGVEIRLIVFPAEQIVPGGQLKGREIFRLARPLTVDNYEALSVRRRPDGRLVAYLMSDDNFNILQTNLLMAVLLPADLARNYTNGQFH